MISPSYNLEHFIDSIKDKDIKNAILLAELEATKTARCAMHCNNGADEASEQRQDYYDALITLINFLRYEIKVDPCKKNQSSLLNSFREQIILKGENQKNIREDAYQDRSETERRQFEYTAYIPERRSGSDRRKGKERRKIN
jgi:hypothetical protein